MRILDTYLIGDMEFSSLILEQETKYRLLKAFSSLLTMHSIVQ